MATTQLAHQPMGWFGNQQLTDPLDSLFGCARMVHVSSLRAVSLFLLSPYLSGMLLATFPPIVTVVPALFEPCLTKKGVQATSGLGLLGTTPSWNMMMNCDTLLMVGSSFPYSEFFPIDKPEDVGRAIYEA